MIVLASPVEGKTLFGEKKKGKETNQENTELHKRDSNQHFRYSNFPVKSTKRMKFQSLITEICSLCV